MSKSGKNDPASKRRQAAGYLPRLKKLSKKESKKLAKTTMQNRPEIPGSFRHSKATFKLLLNNWKLFSWLSIIYLGLNIIFASGISNLNLTVTNLQSSLEEASQLDYGKISTALGGFGSLVGSGGASASQTASVLQMVIIILESLVIIWALRRVMANQKVSVKEAYYKSTSQLVPFLLVLFVVLIQLIPLSLGGALFQFTALNFSATAALITGIIFLLLAFWSVRMLSSSIFALYIVTLPDMMPRDALRSAKKVVRYRRFAVAKRLLFLPILVLVVMAAVTIPLIIFVTPLVAPIFYALSAFALVFAHTYIYGLYRSLIREQ